MLMTSHLGKRHIGGPLSAGSGMTQGGMASGESCGAAEASNLVPTSAVVAAASRHYVQRPAIRSALGGPSWPDYVDHRSQRSSTPMVGGSRHRRARVARTPTCESPLRFMLVERDKLAARLRWHSADAQGRTIDRETIEILRLRTGMWPSTGALRPGLSTRRSLANGACTSGPVRAPRRRRLSDQTNSRWPTSRAVSPAQTS